MSLSQKVRLWRRRSSSTLAEIASKLVGVIVDTIISRSISDLERDCAACAAGVMGIEELNEVRKWYFIELGRTCVAHVPSNQLTRYGIGMRYLGRLLEHANATSNVEVRGGAQLRCPLE
jgi:hypothetical protein